MSESGVNLVNVEGALLTLKHVSNLMIAQGIGGDIIIMSTKNVPNPGAGFGAYSATKAACHQLGRIASLELAEYGLLFVRGAHEDHFWLRRRREAGVGLELIPGLFWLADGYQTVLHENMRVTGLGGVYSPQYYDEEEGWKTKLRAYRRRQVEKACSSGQTDVLLIHEHPNAEGIQEIVFATRPQLIIYPSKDGQDHDDPFQSGVQCYGIPKGHDPIPFEWKGGKISVKD